MTLPGKAVSAFFGANVAVSERLAGLFGFPSDKPFWQRFEKTAAERLLALAPGAVVLDLGGGRRCVYAGALPPEHGLKLIAVDISAEELAENRDVAETRVANVAQSLPFPDGSVDLILSRALMEHIDDNPAAVTNMARVLRPGGHALHFVPCRYSLFGMAARWLPFDQLLWLLHAVRPATRGQVEFKVFYDHCHPDAMRKLFESEGFRDVHIDVCWAQPGYFEAVPPLFLLTSLYERVVQRLGLTRMAAYMIVSAER